MYADAYLAQTDGPYPAACGRRVPLREPPQTLSMDQGSLQSTRTSAANLTLCGHGGRARVVWRELDEPSALRWMAGRKGWVSCGLKVRDEPSSLRWMAGRKGWVSCGSHRRCAGWLGERLSFLWWRWWLGHRRCVGWLIGVWRFCERVWQVGVFMVGYTLA